MPNACAPRSRGRAVVAEPAVSRKEQKRLEAEERNRRFAQRKPLEARIKSAEKEIEALGAERLRLEKLIAAPDMYGERQKGRPEALPAGAGAGRQESCRARKSAGLRFPRSSKALRERLDRR